jgi:hypothetical protein
MMEEEDTVAFARDAGSIYLLVMVGYTHNSVVEAITTRDFSKLEWSGRTPNHLS